MTQHGPCSNLHIFNAQETFHSQIQLVLHVYTLYMTLFKHYQGIHSHASLRFYHVSLSLSMQLSTAVK